MRLLDELLLLFLIKLRGSCRASGHGYSNLLEEILLAGRRADAQEANGLRRNIMKLMRGVGRNVYGISGPHDRLLSAERRLHFSFQKDEGFFEVMTMGTGSTVWRNMHIDHAEAAIGFVTGHGDGVRVTHKTDMLKSLVGVRLCNGESAL